MPKRPDLRAVDDPTRARLEIEFEQPYLLGPLFGEYDRHLVAIEDRLSVNIAARGTRAQIEGVRTLSSLRGRGIGETLFEWAFAQAKSRGASLVQLTSDTSRGNAHRFYEHLGFVASHTGFKKEL